MDTNFSKYNDDKEEDEEEICNNIALADAQVVHTHEFFLDASECSIWRQMKSCTQTENQRRRLPEDEEVPPEDAVLARGVVERVDLPMDDYVKALCKEE
jgi:hypothetical protein